MRSFTALLLAAVSVANAALVVVNPTAATECSATLACTLSWKDDSTSPTLSQIGASKVQICSGSPNKQTCLQTVATAVNVASNSSLVFYPNPPIGPTGRFYFMKFTSNALKDSNGDAVAAYSAYFSLVGMTGAWDQDVEGLAQSAAGDGSTTSVAQPTTQTGAASSTAASVTVVATTTSRTSASGSSSSSATDLLPTGTSSAAAPIVQQGVILSASIVAVLVTVGGVCLGALALGF